MKSSSISILLAIAIVMAPNVFASDNGNLCLFDPQPSSANISLPADEAIHYPDQWTGDPLKVNMFDESSGVETVFKTWHWSAYPVGGGKPVNVSAFRLYAAVFAPSPFLGGVPGWVRVFLSAFLGPDGIYRHYLYLAPGEFSPRQNGYDLSVGGDGEAIVLEVHDGTGNITPVENPQEPIGHAELSGGNGFDVQNTSDGFIRLKTFETSLKSPVYGFEDGFDPEFKYIWDRPWIGSWGALSYGGRDYILVGSGWEERQWGLSLPVVLSTWNDRRASIQIEGCLTASGRKFACEHSMRTILAFDIHRIPTGERVMPNWTESGPPPFCHTHQFTEPEDWSLTPLEYWVSPSTGIRYTKSARLLNAARKVDLTVTTEAEDQEVTKAAILFPGWYEGSAFVEGMINDKRVYGRAFLESFNLIP